MSVTGAVSVWDKINGWMAPLDGMVDALMRPLVQPLADMFDSVTGDSAEVRSTAQRWRDLGTTIDRLAQHHRDVIAPLSSAWEGEAHDAFQAAMRELLTAVDQLADDTRETADFLEDAAMEVELAEELVATIIQELIEWALLTLAVSAALSLVTLGASAVAGGAAAAAEAAVAGSRIATVLAKVASALERLSALLKAVKAMKTFSREGFLIRTLLVNGVILKPVVSTLTGLTGNPLGEGARSVLDSLRDIAADEADDQIDGRTGVQTPVRDRLDDVLGPAVGAGRPVIDAVRPVLDVLDDVDDRVPDPPFAR